MNHPLRSRRVLAGAAALAGAILLAGCSSSTTSGSTTTTQKTVPGQTTIPYSPAKNARTDVTIATPCVQSPATGLWMATGTVKNSSNTARGYSIVIDFVNSVATVQDTRIVRVPTVQPAKTANWTVGGAKGIAGVSCVIRQVQTVAP